MAEKPFAAYEGDQPYFFVSYAHENREAVYREMAWIHEAGFNLWYDDGIHIGTVWRRALANALAGAIGLVYFCTGRSTRSANCLKEINFALDQEKPIFVVQLDDEELPYELRLSLSDTQALVRSASSEAIFREKLTDALEPLVRQNLPDTDSVVHSVTVLPFEVIEPESMPTGLSQCVVEEIMLPLAAEARIKVASLRSATVLSRQPLGAGEIGGKLGSDSVLSGTLMAEGERIRATVRLDSSQEDSLIWSSRYRLRLADRYALTERLATKIVDGVKRHLALLPPEPTEAELTAARIQLLAPSTDEQGATALLGIDLGGHCLKLVELSQKGSDFVLERCLSAPTISDSIVDGAVADPDSVGEVLQRMVNDNPPVLRSAVLAIGGSKIISKVLDLPAQIGEQERDVSIRNHLDDIIPFPLEEICFDYEQLPGEHEGQHRFLVAACRRELVEAKRKALTVAGLSVAAFDLESLAWHRALARAVDNLPKDGVVALVDLGYSMTTLTAYAGIGPVPYQRAQLFGGAQLLEEIQRRYAVSAVDARLAVSRGGLPDGYQSEVLQPFKEATVHQITRCLQFFFSSSTHSSIDMLVLTGGLSGIPGIADIVSKALGCPCESLNPFANVTVSPDLPADRLADDANSFALALGLALRPA